MGVRLRRLPKTGLFALAAVALLTTGMAHHPGSRWTHGRHWYSFEMPPVLNVADAQRLRPGQSLWRGTSAFGGVIRIVIDLIGQKAYVFQGNELIGLSTVSTGRRGYETPTGVFPVLQKARWHRSNRYNGAPMPYMQRLTWDGVALHAGGVPGYRQSHGCIHLPRSFARALYAVTPIGTQVDVIDRQLPELIYASGSMPSTAEAVAQMIALPS